MEQGSSLGSGLTRGLEYPRGAILLWLAAAALALLALPLSSLLDAVQSEVSNLQAAIVAGQVSRISPVSAEEIDALRAAAAEAAALEHSLDVALRGARQGGVAWPAVLQRVIPNTPQIQIDSIVQQQDMLAVTGTADSEAALTDLAISLRASPLFVGAQVTAAGAPTEENGARVTFSISLRLQGFGP